MAVPTRLSLFKHNNGIYYISYILESGRHWKTTRTESKREAPAFLSEFKARMKMQMGG